MKEKYFVSLEFKDTDLAAAHQIMQQVSGLCNYPFSMRLNAMPSEKGKKVMASHSSAGAKLYK